MANKRSCNSADSSSSSGGKRNRPDSPPSTENSSTSINLNSNNSNESQSAKLSHTGLSYPPAPLNQTTTPPPPLTSPSSIPLTPASLNTPQSTSLLAMDDDKPGSMASEQTRTYCKNSACMFFGSANTEGYCSVCFKDYVKKKNQPPIQVDTASSSNHSSAVQNTSVIIPSSTAAVEISSSTDASGRLTGSVPVPIDSSSIVIPKIGSLQADIAASPCSSSGRTPGTSPGKSKKRRCGMCNKKVGLTGFNCRCGNLYCPIHRHSTDHNCSFDYQSSGREQLKKDNPVVQDLKVDKI